MVKKIKVINFHDVKSKKWFESSILTIGKYYDFINPKRLYDTLQTNIKIKTNSCLITVDDGDKSYFDIIFPILSKYKIPSILFVSPKIIKERTNFWFQEIRSYDHEKLNRIISDYFKVELIDYSNGTIFKSISIKETWDIINAYKRKHNIAPQEPRNIDVSQLLKLNDSDLVTIGAHTQNHPILMNEDENSSNKEITSSVNDLKDIINEEIEYFAYPNGIPNVDYSKREKECIKKNKIKLAFSTHGDSISNKYSNYEIPRFGVSYGSNRFITLKLFLGKYWEVLKKIKNNNNSDMKNRRQVRSLIYK